MAEPARRSKGTFKSWIELPEPGGDSLEFPRLSEGGAPLPRRRATQDTKHGHGFWNWLAGRYVEGITLPWLEAVLALNTRDNLRVGINRQGHDEFPIMLAARNVKPELVGFMIDQFKDDLHLPRADHTNLLEIAIERLPREVYTKVAHAFPRLIGPDYGGKESQSQDPLSLCIRRGHLIPDFFLEHRERAFDPQVCRLAIAVRHPSNLYRVLKSVQAAGDERHMATVICCARRKLNDPNFRAYSSGTMPRRAAWHNSHTICRLFLQSTSDRHLHEWEHKQSGLPLLTALLFFLRAHATIVDAIWRVDLVAEASLMPNRTRLSLHAIDDFAAFLTTDTCKKQEPHWCKDEAYIVERISDLRRVARLPIHLRTDIDGHRGRVAEAWACARVSQRRRTQTALRTSIDKPVVPFLPPEIWRTILGILCTQRWAAAR